MINYTKYFNNRGIIGIIRRSCNYVDPRLMDHGFRVGYLVSHLLNIPADYNRGYSSAQIRDICILAMMHDIGAYKTEEIDRLVEFEADHVWEHSVYGYLFIRHFTPLKRFADAILWHHTPWNMLETLDHVSAENKILAQIISIADRADVFLTVEGGSTADFIAEIEREKGERFCKEAVEWMQQILGAGVMKKEVCSDLTYLNRIYDTPFTADEISGYLQMIIFTIDFRSAHTVTHTITTTCISYEIAKRLKIDHDECGEIICGALLHDAGKIGTPVEILEFPGRLSPQAMSVMRCHVGITRRILGTDIDESIKKIAVRHHEKLDGSGYPEQLTGDQLSVSERIVAIADITSALAGTRSYKEAYDFKRIRDILQKMSADGLIDAAITTLLTEALEEVIKETQKWCEPILHVYANMQEEYQELCLQYKTWSIHTEQKRQ